MNEQQSPKAKQNIVRFPSSRRERQRLLRENKDPRVRITVLLRTVCGWLLVVCTFLFLLTNYRMLTPTSIRSMVEYAVAGLQQHEGDITTINYENGTFSDAALFEAGLAGRPDSAARRQALKKTLGLPERLSSKGLLQALNALFTREEFLSGQLWKEDGTTWDRPKKP